MMRDDFCAFILTHGRPDKVITYNTLKKAGYTGKIYIVIDDEDKTADRYREKYGDKVLQFCKSEVAARIDEGDNFNDRRAIIYARNACFDLAKQVGCKYFIELDDDYTAFRYVFDGEGQYRTDLTVKTRLDDVLCLLLEYYESISALTIAMAQGGDFIGGRRKISARRKAMNSFICSVDRPFQFSGRINEDVNTYTSLGHRGLLFLTIMAIRLEQIETQHNSGGMTEMYLDNGTYIKSFYTVMYAPSCAQIGVMGNDARENGAYRVHHKINWHKTAPKILSEQYKKGAKRS
jgi:hypothetical protein